MGGLEHSLAREASRNRQKQIAAAAMQFRNPQSQMMAAHPPFAKSNQALQSASGFIQMDTRKIAIEAHSKCYQLERQMFIG